MWQFFLNFRHLREGLACWLWASDKGYPLCSVTASLSLNRLTKPWVILGLQHSATPFYLPCLVHNHNLSNLRVFYIVKGKKTYNIKNINPVIHLSQYLATVGRKNYFLTRRHQTQEGCQHRETSNNVTINTGQISRPADQKHAAPEPEIPARRYRAREKRAQTTGGKKNTNIMTYNITLLVKRETLDIALHSKHQLRFRTDLK